MLPRYNELVSPGSSKTHSAGAQLTCNICRGGNAQCLSNTDASRHGHHLWRCPVRCLTGSVVRCEGDATSGA